MSCEICKHPDTEHKVLTFASGRIVQKCKGLGVEKRPMEPGSDVMGTHYNCSCVKDMTPKVKVYIIKSLDRRTNKVSWLGEFKTKEEAQKKVDHMDFLCDEIWCENHHNWIEELK